MNTPALTALLSLRPLRQWLARWSACALPQPTVSETHTSALPSPSVPLCSAACAKPKAAVTAQHRPGKFTATVQQWVNEQPKPHTLVVYVNADTTQITQFRTLRDDAAHELFSTPAYNTPDTEWQRVGKNCLRRKDADLVSLFEEQEFCLRNLEEMLAARWHASESLAKLHNRTICAFETAFPAGEDVASISMEQRQAALAQFKTLLLESDGAIQELFMQDDALIPALDMLGIELPEAIRHNRTM
jgi:hypothetical protein